jgi:hypothetical protein
MTLSSSAKSIVHMKQNFIAHVQMKVSFTCINCMVANYNKEARKEKKKIHKK